MDTLIFDVDGTICPIKGKNQLYEDLVPYSNIVKKMREYKVKGYRIVLFTARNMRTYNGDIKKILKYTKPILEQWLMKWNIPYDEIIYGKPWPGPHGLYIDDRSIRPRDFLEKDLEEINKICEIDRNI